MTDVTHIEKGIIDNTLGFIVTSLELPDVRNFPDWIQPSIPRLQPRYQRRVSVFEEDEDDSIHSKFLGRVGHPIERVSAQNLPAELALLGIVPRSFSIYIKRVRGETIFYRLNIRWSTRPMEWDEEEFVKALDTRQLFEELQLQYAWGVTGTEFEQKVNDHITRSLVLDFRSRHQIIPSMRYGTIGVKNSRIVLCPN